MITKTDVNKLIEDKLSRSTEIVDAACKKLEGKLRKEFDRKLEALSVQMQGKIDALNGVIQMKDELLAKTNQEIGELKASFNFVSEETSDLSGKIKLTNIQVDKCKSDQQKLEGKAVDLEDRSRRNNLVFFNIPEETTPGTVENCETKIHNLFVEVALCNKNPNTHIHLDRAHRLGPVKKGSNRPRPLIVRCTYYKDKETIIKTASKHFNNHPVNVSEDYSKQTIFEHRSLIMRAKEAKAKGLGDSRLSLLNYRLGYRRISLIYSSNKANKDAPTFRKSFTLAEIEDNPNWFIPVEKK